MGERSVRNAEVRGSIPLCSTISFVLAVAALIPVLGAVLSIAVLMIGFGAMMMQMIGSRWSATI